MTPWLVRAAERGEGVVRNHPLNANAELRVWALGERCGLQRAACNVVRLAPGKESHAYHAHHVLEEWMFVVSGRGRAEVDGVFHALAPGDFLGFPTPSRAHHVVNDSPEELVYVVGSEKGPVEIGDFPRHGLRVVLGPMGRAVYRLDSQVGYDGKPAAPQLASSDKPYFLAGADRDLDAPPETMSHPLNPRSEVRGWTLGNAVGLQRCGVSLISLAPEKESFVLHTHLVEEEWMFVLAGQGVARVDDAEIPVGPGDFLGFSTPSRAHHLRNASNAPLVYLSGGERKPVEIAEFPEQGLKLLRTQLGATLFPVSAELDWDLQPKREMNKNRKDGDCDAKSS